ncbi:hypothetical protein HQQ80_14045 [Microbacteriaceae bacterium VKM Ac-2855]|nr:hypothetical protein [Microbacteriaceae bacterium VKM Ac-2855]
MISAGGRWPSRAQTALDEFLRRAGPPAFGLVEQGCLEPMDAIPAFTNGHFVSLSLSYTYYRVPDDRGHPANRVPLTIEQQTAIDRAESSALDEGTKDIILRMRFPVAWDAVRTTIATAADRKRPLSERLHSHIDDVLRALPSAPTVEGGRPHADSTGDVDTCSILVGGVEVRGIRATGRGAVAAIGFELERRIVTAVIPQDFLPAVRLEFVPLACTLSGEVSPGAPSAVTPSAVVPRRGVASLHAG